MAVAEHDFDIAKYSCMSKTRQSRSGRRCGAFYTSNQCSWVSFWAVPSLYWLWIGKLLNNTRDNYWNALCGCFRHYHANLRSRKDSRYKMEQKLIISSSVACKLGEIYDVWEFWFFNSWFASLWFVLKPSKPGRFVWTRLKMMQRLEVAVGK